MVTSRRVKVALPLPGHQPDLAPEDKLASPVPDQRQVAVVGPDRELAAQRGLVKQGEPAIEDAAGLSLVLVDATERRGS